MSRHGSILVVDDDEHARESVAEVLQMEGFHVLKAGGGREAIAALSDPNHRICAVVLDLFMGDIDGDEVLRRKATDPRVRDIPVVVMTGHSPEPGTLDAGGVVGVVQKGGAVESLLSMIHRHCPP